ncbi:MAG: helix-turn-helix transcriptional regulator [Ruminococcus sp.]|nr:helix-turn-helix transcriptional regulator [Ruminococcus sp.]
MNGHNNIKQFRETTAHGTPQFPMKIYKNDFSWYTNRTIDWHWHPEIEIAVVLSGKVTCFINDTRIDAAEGEGFFINSNTMHKEIPYDENEKPIMTTVCFLPDFIGDCGSDLIYRKYIRPIIADAALKGLKLSGEIEWQRQMLDIVRSLFELSSCNSWGYELKCRNMMSELWYCLSKNLLKEPHPSAVNQKANVNEKRLKRMLSFIHENFQKELTIEEIAKSANISKSECFRCFKTMIDKKPISYLNEYRLKHAVDLLLTTDMQITEICFSCGFNHISYFGKMFRRYYGITPKQFRNSN